MADAPSRRISVRASNADGTELILAAKDGVPLSDWLIGCGAMRRPLIRVSVLPEPSPRRSIDTLSPRASWPATLSSLRAGGEDEESDSNISDIVEAPRRSNSSRSIIVTGIVVS